MQKVNFCCTFTLVKVNLQIMFKFYELSETNYSHTNCFTDKKNAFGQPPILLLLSYYYLQTIIQLVLVVKKYSTHTYIYYKLKSILTTLIAIS